MFNFFRNKQILKGVNYLDLTPFTINEFELKDNIVVVLVKKFNSKVMQSLLPRNRTNYIKIHLDETGSLVWLNIDGKRNVAEIIEEIKLVQEDKLPHAEERITKFLTQLFQQKFIGFQELNKQK
jgi:hypothetical protein